MSKSELVNTLCALNTEEFAGFKGDLEEFCKHKVENIPSLNLDDDISTFSSIKFDYEDRPYEWKFICTNLHILNLLNSELSKSDSEVLSVQETKNIKFCLKNLLILGILKNIQPNLPHYLKLQTSNTDIICTYNVLKCTVGILCNFLKYPNLRMLILPHSLQGILVALFQLSYCPLKKPLNSSSEFVVSETTYNKLKNDQQLFKIVLDDLRESIHPAIFVKETMVLFQSNSPNWFKKAISNTLTATLRSKNGVKNIALAMLDGADDDRAKTWNVLDILTKLIISCRKSLDFRENICRQLTNLLDEAKSKDLFVFERLVICCTKALFSEDEKTCKSVFVKRIMTPVLHFAYKEHNFRDGDVVTNDIKQSIRLIYGSFIDNSVNLPCLPIELLKTVINVTFYLYHLTVKSSVKSNFQANELRELLIKYLQCCSMQEIDQLFDSFLFGFAVTDVPQFRNDVIIVEIDKEMVVKCSGHTVIYATAETADTLFNLLEDSQKTLLFGYLLKCITEKEKYFKLTNQELLSSEGQSSPVLERLLTTHRLLSQLSEDKGVQEALKSSPENVISYISNVLLHTIKNNAYNVDETAHVFTIVMILENLVLNSSKKVLSKYEILVHPLSVIGRETTNDELRNYCYKIVNTIKDQKVEEQFKEEKSELEQALEDLCDPLLPIRGHALMVLAKLVEKKDKDTMERKQYLLNMFQLQLKNEDSYIYLNAVQGLAALADVFPDSVIEVLCEEFADYRKPGNAEVRMKLGEVLVRVVKLLGDMAPKYKALLLNTFLSGTKDDDHLIRASSLSNLGEVCRILSYKLGTVVTEVLVCVHAVITTDKAVEARRAAVTVIRQLFVGLETEMIAFLKEDILHVYRTLKEVYHNDEDDVMKLQAQLALEELNENMKKFVFPKPKLDLEKKIVILN